MSVDPFYIKKHDLQPAYRARAQYAVDSPVDLTGASFRTTMRDVRNGTSVISYYNGGITLTDPTSGDFEYGWQGSDTALPGHYKIEFEITPQVGGKFTIPANPDQVAKVIILDSLDNT